MRANGIVYRALRGKMFNIADLLKKSIEKQKLKPTLEVRQHIYEKARLVIQNKLKEMDALELVARSYMLQLEAAICEVEAFYVLEPEFFEMEDDNISCHFSYHAYLPDYFGTRQDVTIEANNFLGLPQIRSQNRLGFNTPMHKKSNSSKNTETTFLKEISEGQNTVQILPENAYPVENVDKVPNGPDNRDVFSRDNGDLQNLTRPPVIKDDLDHGGLPEPHIEPLMKEIEEELSQINKTIFDNNALEGENNHLKNTDRFKPQPKPDDADAVNFYEPPEGDIPDNKSTLNKPSLERQKASFGRVAEPNTNNYDDYLTKRQDAATPTLSKDASLSVLSVKCNGDKKNGLEIGVNTPINSHTLNNVQAPIETFEQFRHTWSPKNKVTEEKEYPFFIDTGANRIDENALFVDSSNGLTNNQLSETPIANFSDHDPIKNAAIANETIGQNYTRETVVYAESNFLKKQTAFGTDLTSEKVQEANNPLSNKDQTLEPNHNETGLSEAVKNSSKETVKEQEFDGRAANITVTYEDKKIKFQTEPAQKNDDEKVLSKPIDDNEPQSDAAFEGKQQQLQNNQKTFADKTFVAVENYEPDRNATDKRTTADNNKIADNDTLEQSEVLLREDVITEETDTIAEKKAADLSSFEQEHENASAREDASAGNEDLLTNKEDVSSKDVLNKEDVLTDKYDAFLHNLESTKSEPFEQDLFPKDPLFETKNAVQPEDNNAKLQFLNILNSTLGSARVAAIGLGVAIVLGVIFFLYFNGHGSVTPLSGDDRLPDRDHSASQQAANEDGASAEKLAQLLKKKYANTQLNGADKPKKVVAQQEKPVKSQADDLVKKVDMPIVDNREISNVQSSINPIIKVQQTAMSAQKAPEIPKHDKDVDSENEQSNRTDGQVPPTPSETNEKTLESGLLLLTDNKGKQQKLSGNVEWTLAPPHSLKNPLDETALIGSFTTDDGKLGVKMTIRKNYRDNLAATHLIDLSFNESKDFDGGLVVEVKGMYYGDKPNILNKQATTIIADLFDNNYVVSLRDDRDNKSNNEDFLKKSAVIGTQVVFTDGKKAVFMLDKGEAGNKIFSQFNEKDTY